MAHARIRVELPTGQWKADATRKFPNTAVRLRTSVVADENATEVVVLSDNPRLDHLCAIRSHPTVDASSVVHRSEQEIILQVETSLSPVLTAANHAATPLSHPIELFDGHALIDILGTHESIERFGRQLTEADLTFDILSLHRNREREHVLTQRQREFVHAAVDLGYYETPRQCSLTEVATEMDVAKSTCCSILHRAEQAIVECFLTHDSLPNRRENVHESIIRSPS